MTSFLKPLLAIVLAMLLIFAWGPAVHAAPQTQESPRFFQETGFAIDNNAFFDYFESRGRVQTFGYPVSGEFKLAGFTVQIFQRGVMQQAPDGSVRLLNLLDQGIMPAKSINSSRFPAPDDSLIAATPSVESPDYPRQMIGFIAANVPDEFEGLPVDFRQTFLHTFDSPGTDEGLLTMLNLEFWGAPTSRPAFDPSNRGFVYQRFQRGIMHFDTSTGTTKGLLLGDWFKSVLTGRGLPVDLEEEMVDSPYLRLYDNRLSLGLARPRVLPDSDFTGAFGPLKISPAHVAGQPLLYPDLRTLPPSDLRLSSQVIDGTNHRVIRFTTTIWNGGPGPLEMRESAEDSNRIDQWVFDAAGGHIERQSGMYVFSDGHRHWHMAGFASYELWTRAAFDAWIASNRTNGAPQWQQSKVSFCLMDSRKIAEIEGSSEERAYPLSCERPVQGISVAWADRYAADLDDQWIDVGTRRPADGEYILRNATDPEGFVHESEGGTDPAREGPESNEGMVAFTIQGEQILSVVSIAVRGGQVVPVTP